jgi:DNA-binding GntR family transcriptional regulator
MGIHRSCMRDPVRDAIVSRILDGVYPPGTRLKELSLAREFNVSQAPIREALRELQALHLVETEHYRGTRVRSIDLDELREAYELRVLIEQAAVRRAVPCAQDDIGKLDAELKVMRHSADGNNFDDYMASAVRFHRQLVTMSGNGIFLRAWESMAWDVRARVAAKRTGLIGLGHYISQRRKIVAALRSGDGVRAATLLAEITRRVLHRLAGIEKNNRP